MPNMLASEYSLNVNLDKWARLTLYTARLLPVYIPLKVMVQQESDTFFVEFTERREWLKQHIPLHVIKMQEQVSPDLNGVTVKFLLYVPREKDLLHYKMRWDQFVPKS